MTVDDLAASCRRYWYVLVAVLGLTAVAAVGMVHSTLPYQASSAFVLLPPSSWSGANTLVATAPDLTAVADSTARTLNDDAWRSRLVADGLTAEYTVVLTNTGTTQTPSYGVPTVTITTTSSSSTTAAVTLRTLLEQFRDEMTKIQTAAGATPPSLISTRPLNSAPALVQPTGRPTRALIALFPLGGVLACATARMADLAGQRRRARRGGSAAMRGLPA